MQKKNQAVPFSLDKIRSPRILGYWGSMLVDSHKALGQGLDGSKATRIHYEAVNHLTVKLGLETVADMHHNCGRHKT